MALFAPIPSYPTIIDSPNYDPSSSSSSSTHSTSTTTRQVSRSERMLLAALRRADEHQSSNPNHYQDADYFNRPGPTQNSSVWSKSPSTASPSRSLKRPHTHTHTHTHLSASPTQQSPLAQRVVDRERSARRRTPSPSPHPHPYRPSSPRMVSSSAVQSSPIPPHLNRTHTAPAQQWTPPSRPSTPVLHQGADLARRSTSPARPYPRQHSRKQSASGDSIGVGSAATKLQRSAHEEYLRARLEGVLAAAGPMEGVTSTASRSRGQSLSMSIPPAMVATDAVPPLPKSPQAQRLASASPGRAMITPPPSPPHHSLPLNSTSHTPSRTPSQVRVGLGLGRPSRASSIAPTSLHEAAPVSSTSSPSSSRGSPSPPAFDARSASLALKNQHGYVSFCDVEGLGEPDGLDAEDECGAEGLEGCEGCDDPEKRGRWWELWRK